ncbi:MAG TPA: hypothetical protein VGP88_01660 [Thermoplasmata archaeon]|nr:hypothetical protein [Thermoplasmata archaeon]
MTGFDLSPGITPALTDVFVVVVPLAVGLGYLLAKRSGFEAAFAVSAIALGAIKVSTDYSDVFDLAVALAAIVGGAVWLWFSVRGRAWNGRVAEAFGWLLGIGSVVVGLLKLRDFYDPFDILLADATVVAGVAVLVYLREARTARPTTV